MQVELNLLLEVLFISLLVKLVIGQWNPPVQKSLQAILVCIVGSGTGLFLNPSKEGFVVGLVASAFAFYGRELVDAFHTVYSDVQEVGIKTNEKLE